MPIVALWHAHNCRLLLFGRRTAQGKQVHTVAKNKSKPIGVCLEYDIGTDLTAAKVLDIESEEKYAVQTSQEGELRILASQNNFFDQIFEDFPASIRSWVAKREKVAHAQRMLLLLITLCCLVLFCCLACDAARCC